MANFHSGSIDRLFKVILNLGTIDECYDLFEDVCTIKEIQNMAQRLDAAILLDSGENYQEISKKLDTSTATISRVSKCLNYGTGGYRKALDYIKNEKD